VILNTTLGVLLFWACGYAFAFGTNHPFIGSAKFFSISFEDGEYSPFGNYVFLQLLVFQTACATVASSIMSGGTAERMTIPAWAIVSSIFIGFVYPVAAHWNFGQGWLVTSFHYHDLAGSGNLHFLAGVAALVTTIILKPRAGRFTSQQLTFSPFNTTYAALGALLVHLP
jgi:Amt family ammonium transporter